MRALDGEPFVDGIDNGAVMQLLELGYKNFGPTFNFTVGCETVDNHLFVYQRALTEVLDSINFPAWYHRFTESY